MQRTQLFRMKFTPPFSQELIGTFNSLQEAQAYVQTHQSQFDGYAPHYNMI